MILCTAGYCPPAGRSPAMRLRFTCGGIHHRRALVTWVLLFGVFAGHKASDTQVPWLGSVLEALLQRAAELDLAPDTSAAAGPAEAAAAAAELAGRWGQQFDLLYALVHRHTAALHEAFKAGREVGDAEGCAEVRGLVPIGLVRTMLPLCRKAQQDELRAILVDFGA